MTIEPSTLVSFLGEDRLSGSWTLGLAAEALQDVRLVLSVSASRFERVSGPFSPSL